MHSFPTRRSSDLKSRRQGEGVAVDVEGVAHHRLVGRDDPHSLSLADAERGVLPVGRSVDRPLVRLHRALECELEFGDRKSTRLNSSHVAISYAVFCLKKKK